MELIACPCFDVVAVSLKPSSSRHVPCLDSRGTTSPMPIAAIRHMCSLVSFEIHSRRQAVFLESRYGSNFSYRLGPRFTAVIKMHVAS